MAGNYKPVTDTVVRVKLKVRENASKPPKETVTSELYNNLNVPLVRLFEQKDSYIAVMRNADEADKLMSDAAEKFLSKINLVTVDHPKIKACRTLVFKQVDPYIGQRTAEEIKQEILDKQDWIGIRQVIKIKDFTHIFKVEFQDSKISERVRREGLLLFNMAIGSTQIEPEIYVDVVMCMKCYAIESHNTNKCPTPNKVICSECAVEGHTFKQCQSKQKTCINCGGAHRATSMACMERKNVVKMKQRNAKMHDKSYANVLSSDNYNYSRVGYATSPNLNLIDPTMCTKIMTCLIHAHMVNLGNPGTFNEELKEIFHRNNIPQLEFPSNPPSHKIMGIMTNNDELINNDKVITNNELINEESENEEQIEMEEGLNMEIKNKLRNTNKRKRQNETELQKKKPNKQQAKYTTEQLGMEIYCTKANKPVNSEALKMGILNGTVRWVCEENSNEDILSLANEDKIMLIHKSIEVVPHNEFIKIPQNKVDPNNRQ